MFLATGKFPQRLLECRLTAAQFHGLTRTTAPSRIVPCTRATEFLNDLCLYDLRKHGFTCVARKFFSWVAHDSDRMPQSRPLPFRFAHFAERHDAARKSPPSRAPPGRHHIARDVKSREDNGATSYARDVNPGVRSARSPGENTRREIHSWRANSPSDSRNTRRTKPETQSSFGGSSTLPASYGNFHDIRPGHGHRCCSCNDRPNLPELPGRVKMHCMSYLPPSRSE